MDRNAAIALASRIEATWATNRHWSQPRVDTWIEALETLDEGAAGTAYARLRGTHPDAPSIARFITETRAAETPKSTPAAHDERERISLGEYLERLQLRATKGGHDAQAELDRWHRHLTGQSKFAAGAP